MLLNFIDLFMIKESNYYDDKRAPYKAAPMRISNSHSITGNLSATDNKNNILGLSVMVEAAKLSHVIPNCNIIEDYDPNLMSRPSNLENINKYQQENINKPKNITQYQKNFYKDHPNQHQISLRVNYNDDINTKQSTITTNNNNNDTKTIPDVKSIWRVYSEKMIIIHDDYVLSKILGKGSFGVVHQGFHKDTYEPVAIKLEDLSAKTRILSKEYLTYMNVYEPDCGLPLVLAFGEKDDYQYMVMQMLGSSLEEHLRLKQIFSLKTVLMLADQMLERMRFLHKKGYLHRDIKPENFLMGLYAAQDTVHLIDLGLAKKWKLPNGSHIKYLSGNKIIGTARYASINSHLGNQLSRRDDMESLGYLLVYLAKGKLPWQNLRSQNKEEKYQQILEKKELTSIDKLCSGLPKEFIQYFKHVKSLRFDEEPCYDFLKGLFLTAFSERRYSFDFHWDWVKV